MRYEEAQLDALMGSMKISGNGQPIRIAAPAKVNLFFELLGKRTDGFHEIETVMSTVSLYDFLEVRPRNDGELKLLIRMESQCQSSSSKGAELESIPSDDRNLVIQAFDRVRELAVSTGKAASGESLGADILLEKRIPSAAGLGGASSDAAAAIISACHIWDFDLSDFEMREIAASIGSDVPFFLNGGMAVCRGRGELIEPIEGPSSMAIVVAKPTVGLSTADVYRACRVPAQSTPGVDLIQSLKKGDSAGVGKRLFNRLETFANELTPAIAELRNEFLDLNCLGHQMSGSGSSYFGIFNNYVDAKRAATKLSARRPDATISCCRTLSSSDRTQLTKSVAGSIRE
jgi:4-diphosphocytidyl-2-C-methyl-D-erythritol kinase